jgi:phenylalanyl-tRNA synthetase alpha chain
MYSVPKLAEWSAAALDAAVRDLLSALEAEAAVVLSQSQSADLSLVQKGQVFDEFKNRWTSRKAGILTQVNKRWLGGAPSEFKREAGRAFNEARAKVVVRVDEVERQANLYRHQRVQPTERLDVTLPGIRRPLGAEHPVIRTMNEICGVFRAMGYSVAEGPEIESDYYNFEALNFPPEHPARDTQDTIFLAGQEAKPARERLLLRTHTSPVQIRTMQRQKPPVRVVIPGKIHRHDAPDASHSPMFHQVEGLAVDTGITFSDLKGTLDHAMKALFGSSVKTRFQPSFFPFTEPSAEVAFSCIFCGGKGCRTCKQSGWIELLGCGMVDPNVFEFVRENGYDPAKVSGFAFGMGVDRVAMLKYGIDDIQLLFQGDVRFLEQFG